MIESSQHIATIELIADGLKHLIKSVAFVGGATVIFYVDEEPGVDHRLRPTNDIDCVIDVVSQMDHARIESELRSLGFNHSMKQGDPICRFTYKGIIVDVMPKDGRAIGFTDRWYAPGLENAEIKTLPSKKEIRVFSIPYFLAAKMEAFNDRGKNDFYGSKDLEDIITVLGARKAIRKDLFAAPPDVKDYLRKRFNHLLENESFVQSVSAILRPYENDEERVSQVLDILKNL